MEKVYQNMGFTGLKCCVMCQCYQINFKCLKPLHVVPFREKLHAVNFQSYLMGERWRVASGEAFPSKSLFTMKIARKI